MWDNLNCWLTKPSGQGRGQRASAAGGEPLRWGASPAGGFPSVGNWRPALPTCSQSVSAGVSKWRFPDLGDWRWGKGHPGRRSFNVRSFALPDWVHPPPPSRRFGEPALQAGLPP